MSLTKNEVEQIWRDVKENKAALDSCEGPHDFRVIGEGLRRTYQCSLCGGTISLSYYLWYARGLKHGQKDTQ